MKKKDRFEENCSEDVTAAVSSERHRDGFTRREEEVICGIEYEHVWRLSLSKQCLFHWS